MSSSLHLSELPFTGKADLRDAYPFGLLRVPVASLARVHASSGTHGKPTVVGYTPADLDAWTELMARCMTHGGRTTGMLVHNANTYGLSPAATASTRAPSASAHRSFRSRAG